VPTAGEPGGLSAGVVFGERRSVDAEQARQDCRAVGSDGERPSRQAQGRGSGAVQHGREAGSLLAQAQAGHEQTSQSLGNHHSLLEQIDLRGHFDVSRILETWKFRQERGRTQTVTLMNCFLHQVNLDKLLIHQENRGG